MRWSHLALCAVLGVLSACGGGGGGSTSGQPSGAFTLSGNSATFSARQNGSDPSSQTLAIQITGPNVGYVGAAYSGGTTQPSWLGINITGSGTTYNLALSIVSTALSPGQYTSTFQVGTADSTQKILQYQSVTVTFTVIAAVAITTQPYSATFIDGGSKTTDAVSVGVSAPGLQWTSTSDSPWLTVPTGAQTGTGSVQAAVNVASLGPGTYQGHVTVTDAADSTNSATLTFSVTVQAPTLSVTQASIVLGGADGLSTSTPQSVSFSLSTDTEAHPFAITFQTDSGGSWLASNVTTGTVNAAGATIQVSGNRTGLVGGTYTGEVEIAATIGNVVVTGQVPVTFNVEANRIVVGASGVGFSSSPAGSVLTRNVTVFSTLGRTDVPWQASSDQSWLTVTPSGVTGGAITLTASPSGLSTDTTHFATVTVTSSDPSVENQQTIRVGLYASSAAPTNLSQSVAEGFVATSPVEPIAFLSDGGTDVTGYNVYTGQIDRTFAGVVAHADQMAVSGDGQSLFVYDGTNQRVTELDATTGSVIQQYSSSPLPPAGNASAALAYVRPNGYAMLITPSSRAYDLATGTEYDNGTLYGVTNELSLEASPDNSKVVSDGGTVWSVVRSALHGGEFNVAILFNTGTVQGAEGQACFSSDGQTVYTASGAPYNFYGTSLATQLLTQTLPAEAYPNAITCVWNGLIVGGADAYYDATDVFVYYGPTGAQLALLDSSLLTGYRNLATQGLAVSADGTRMVTLVATNGSNLVSEVRFQSLPAPP
ncbi:MAG TPA: hypothetical protein VGT07_10985 [Steroidobacteraceae bacterium]|nr:hypothetical protein [Steroidobacteraceae bacterium]